MNILLTNDDGINALGIKKVEEILKKYGNVYVVAPTVEQSGKACSINAYRGVKIHKIDSNHISVDGSPVDCVEIALAMIDVDFDLIVSGCNNGYNLSQDVMYSGTCGACIQSLLANKKAIALSIKNSSYFDLLDELLPQTLDYVFKNELLSNQYFLNINFPITLDHKGFMFTKVYTPINETYYPINTEEKDVYIIARKETKQYNNIDSDKNAVNEGYISITPMSQSIYNETMLDLLKNKIK